MSDSGTDLREGDPKYVRYVILFTKADLEAVLEEGEAIVDSQTDIERFTALTFSRFLAKAEMEGVKRPQTWLECGYPPTRTDDTHWSLDAGDLKYVRVSVEVKERFKLERPAVSADETEVGSG